MQSNTVFKSAPTIAENQKVEVSVENNSAVIKLLTFTENLGWSCQKTLKLDQPLLEDLHRSLTAARYRLNNLACESTESHQPSNIIRFPDAA